MRPRYFVIKREQKQFIPPVKTIVTRGVDGSFDREGLFSTEIFGELGTEDRMDKFGRIELNSKLYSPHLFHEMSKLKAFYMDILAGKEFAVWKKDHFEKADFDTEGADTGFAFFMEHVKDIIWEDTGSTKRQLKIRLLEKNKDVLLLEDLIVLPAGLRDIVSKDGKDTEDEINPLYRKLLGLSFMLEGVDSSHKSLDSVRSRMQIVIQEIYNLIMRIQTGKTGFVQGKWTKSSILNGTRNILTASVVKVKDLRTEKSLDKNTTICGIYQYIFAAKEIGIYNAKNRIINRILPDVGVERITVIDKKTGKPKLINNPYRESELLVSDVGIEKIFSKVKFQAYSESPIPLGDGWLANIYDDGKRIKIMTDDELPEGFDRKYVRPMTYLDFVSISGLEEEEPVGTVTRYPITGEGSIYPTKFFVKPTHKIRKVEILDESWNTELTFHNFHVHKGKINTSMSVHHSKLGALGADHDGDKLALTVAYSQEAIADIKKYLRSVQSVIRANGKLVSSLSNKITGFVLAHLTRPSIGGK